MHVYILHGNIISGVSYLYNGCVPAPPSDLCVCPPHPLSWQVTVIQGSTGSGKTTQVPQFVLEENLTAHRHCNIVCTQPRRIAAKSVAKFVAECRGWPLGSLVGYQVGMDKKVSESTRLSFVTTGVLLEKLVNQRNLNEYTHVILDEVCLSLPSLYGLT